MIRETLRHVLMIVVVVLAVTIPITFSAAPLAAAIIIAENVANQHLKDLIIVVGALSSITSVVGTLVYVLEKADRYINEET